MTIIAYNNLFNNIIKITPFYANYGYKAILVNNLKKIIKLMPKAVNTAEKLI